MMEATTQMLAGRRTLSPKTSVNHGAERFAPALVGVANDIGAKSSGMVVTAQKWSQVVRVMTLQTMARKLGRLAGETEIMSRFKARVKRAERLIPPENEPTLMDIVGEVQALGKWLVAQGFADPQGFGHLERSDPHNALAAGVGTPPEFRQITIAELAEAQVGTEIYRWFAEWEGVVFARRRHADPQWRFAHDHNAEGIANGIRRAEEARANLKRWGVTVPDALGRARAMHDQPAPNGGDLAAEKIEEIAAAILEAEAQRSSQRF